MQEKAIGSDLPDGEHYGAVLNGDTGGMEMASWSGWEQDPKPKDKVRTVPVKASMICFLVKQPVKFFQLCPT
jgi:hypothetical protein